MRPPSMTTAAFATGVPPLPSINVKFLSTSAVDTGVGTARGAGSCLVQPAHTASAAANVRTTVD